jgi:hypothetical protein
VGVKLILTLREEHQFRMFENRMLRKIFRPKIEEKRGYRETCIVRSFIIIILSLKIIFKLAHHQIF